jgi:hypothetical protein
MSLPAFDPVDFFLHQPAVNVSIVRTIPVPRARQVARGKTRSVLDLFSNHAVLLELVPVNK